MVSVGEGIMGALTSCPPDEDGTGRTVHGTCSEGGSFDFGRIKGDVARFSPVQPDTTRRD